MTSSQTQLPYLTADEKDTIIHVDDITKDDLDAKVNVQELAADGTHHVSSADGPQSAFGDLTTKATVFKFKRLFSMGLLVGLAAIYMGFTLGIASNIVANRAFIKQFGTVIDDHGELALDATHVSVWGGTNFAAQLVFQAASPLTADRWGVRINLYIMTLAMLVAIVIEIVSTNWIHYLIAKLFSGMACAYLGPGIINYLTEISMPKMRGAMLSSFAFFFSLGGLCASIALKLIADLTPAKFRSAFYSQFAIFGIWVCVLLYLPESPAFLCKKGKHDQAKQSLRRLIGSVEGYDFDHEYSVLQFHVEDSVAMNKKLSESSWAAIFKGSNLRRTVISCLPFTLQAFSGTALIFGYSTFFFSLSGLGDAFLGSLILNLILLFGITISIFSVDYLGRRTLVLIGCAGCALCDIAFGGIGQMPIGPTAGNAVLAVASVWVFFYAGSLATVGWGYLGEVSSLSLRSKTIALATVQQSLISLIFQYTVPEMLSPQKANWGVRIGYLFGGLTFLGMIVVYFFMPETKGRSAQEMDELYARGIPARKFHLTETDYQNAQRMASA
ncbi:hypothetical protein NliqN6_2763 [Naganishia liquefaciens]|uniref:Major facilitator superfamily (MFS) profile domain-containing protein n=1 Tax=Naganishia liquefaciens TaxID=104408 RepID=A0A8H3TSV8_9TREE|nr:hypothetical protein NliqN6_2763 [Naganishia liquefaciens]